MKFTLLNHDLDILAENGREIAELCKHFGLKVEDHVDELIAGRMQYVASGYKRPWFALNADVPFTFLQPYYDRLRVVTGYDGAPFSISDVRLRYPSSRVWGSLCHTHIVTDAFIDADGYHAYGFKQASDWDGRTAAQIAPGQFNEYLRAHLGETKSEPEYLEMPNGLLRRNPNYMARHAPRPGLASEAVFEVIFFEWLNTVATVDQQSFYTAAALCYATVVKTDSLAANLMDIVREFHVDNYKRTVTFEQFKEM